MPRGSGPVLDWKWFSETVPGAQLQMPTGHLLLLLRHRVSPAAHNGNTHSMKTTTFWTLSTGEYLCLFVSGSAWLRRLCFSLKKGRSVLMYLQPVHQYMWAHFISSMLISVSAGRAG